jgi:Zn-dependent protease/CBS domain-containing protein
VFEKAPTIFTLFGFKVKLDFSWLILAFLITWTLAAGYFPSSYEGLDTSTYWIMGIIGAIGIFVSIIFHEMSHSLAARIFDLPITGITLFVFGGVAEMDDEPQNPRSEFFMAVAGPVASVLLGVFFMLIEMWLSSTSISEPVTGVVGYLSFINFILAGFNLIPAFPLDGGRILRATIWHFNDNLKKSTKIAAYFGSAFGIILIILGILNVIGTNLIGGLWWILIGWFIRNASRMAYRQLLFRRALEGESIERFMSKDVVSVSPDISIREFVENVVYKHHFKMYPVTEGEQLLGYIETKTIREIPSENWHQQSVKDHMKTIGNDNSVSTNTDPMEVLTLMNRNDSSRILVVDNNQLKGIIVLKDMLKFLSLKIDLEGEAI